MQALENAQIEAKAANWNEAIKYLHLAYQNCSAFGRNAAALNEAGFKKGAKKLLSTSDKAIPPSSILAAIEWCKWYAEDNRQVPSAIVEVLIGTALANTEEAVDALDRNP
jgi:hypothetical protein